MACLARGNSRTHRLCARWSQHSPDESRGRSQTRRNPCTRAVLLSRIASTRWLARLLARTNLSSSSMFQRRIASAPTDFLLSAGVRRDSFRIAIGAGASYGSAKCWPPDRFAELANRLQTQTQADVILFGTPAEAAVSSAIAAGMNHPPIDLTGKTSINDLPALLSQCHLFIGNDSGAMHVAAAVGLPVVAVFGPTDPFGTAPVTPRCSIVQEKPYCSPCFLRRCPTDHRCMTRVTPRSRRSGRASVDFVDRGASCLKTAHSGLRFFSIVTAPFPKRSAT